MKDGPIPTTKKFKLEWDNPDNLTFILGHHLIFFGVANIWFVEWARWHGIYDPAIDEIRTIFPGYGDFGMVYGHQFDFLTIDSLEEVMSGHAFLAFVQISGGAWHIATKQLGEYTEFKGKGLAFSRSSSFMVSCWYWLDGNCCCFLVCTKYNCLSN